MELPKEKSVERNPRQFGLDDFEAISVIGRGGYAKVLMVELKSTRQVYALKVMKKALVEDDEDLTGVQTEKLVLEQGSNSPFLVGLHCCFQTPSRLFFVMDLARGGDLAYHLQRQGRLPEEHACFYAAEICVGLNFLHGKGIIYRDLKSDNCLLDHEGHIKLTDFGMCKAGIRPGDRASTICGTPNYMAPEVWRGTGYSFAVDFWALGVLVHEMLTGKYPFDVPTARESDAGHADILAIIEKPIRLPRSTSMPAMTVLTGFLKTTPEDRLGCQPETGFMEIMNHPFFKDIKWDLVCEKKIDPPFKPKIHSDREIGNFDRQVASEPLEFTPDDPKVMEEVDQYLFEGFEYVNPLVMSPEN